MTFNASAVPLFDPGGIAAVKTTSQVKIMQGEDMHDTAIITLRNESTAAPELQPGTPVQVHYGWSGFDLDWFYGYIDHIETSVDRRLRDGTTFQDVVCLGASYTLKDPFVGAWTSIQASTLVSQIAAQYRLSTVVENDDTIWPQLANPSDSAWSFLVGLASKTGYTLACNKTLLRFTSIDLALRRSWTNMPVFQTYKAAPAYNNQTISQFHSLTGEALGLNGHTKAVRSVAGLDANGNIVGAVDDGSKVLSLGKTSVFPFFAQQVSDQVVTTSGHAQAVLAGVTQTNRFAYQATALLGGMTALHQGMPIVISGVDSNNDGVWWVQEVTHKIVAPSYSMDVSLGRDAKGDTGLRPVQAPVVAFAPNNPLAYTIANAPPTKLINNRWRAAFQSNVTVS